MIYVYGLYVKGSRFPFYVGSGKNKRITTDKRRNHMVITMMDNNETEMKIFGEFDNYSDAIEVEELITVEYHEMGHCETNIRSGKGSFLRPEYHPMTGKTHTEESKKLQSETKKGDKNPSWGRKGRLHPMFGKSHLVGEKNPHYGVRDISHPTSKGLYITPEGVEYGSANLASEETGVSVYLIRKYCKNNSNGWKFIPKEKV